MLVFKEVNLPISQGLLWELLTSSEYLSKWWNKDLMLEPFVGGRFCEPWVDEKGVHRLARGTVISLEVQKKILFTWNECSWLPETYTLCAFEIEPYSRGSKFRVTHGEWEVLGDNASKTQKHFDRGWSALMDSLKAFAENMVS